METELTEEIQTSLDSIKWEKVTGDRLWKPEIEGEILIGKYLAKQVKADSNGRTKYTFTAPDDEQISVFGTKILDPAMQKISTGCVVKITYLGEKATGQYNDLKLFDVEKAPKDTKIEPMIIIPKHKAGAGLADADDPEAVNMIEHYEGILEDMHAKISKENLVFRAESDDEFSEEEMKRFKDQLDREEEKGRWKE